MPFPLFLDIDDSRLVGLHSRPGESVSALLEQKNLQWDFDESPLAVQLTDAKEALCSHHHTATDTPPGRGYTVFRITSISKTFTVYALPLQSIHPDSVVTEHLPELSTHQNAPAVNLLDVTVQMLASRLNRIARDTDGSCFVCREFMDHRAGLECVYGVSLDKRRKIHLERAHTESALQKELLNRLFDLIRDGDDHIRNRLKDDVHIQNLSQRLGFRIMEDPGDSLDQVEEIRSWPSSQSWENILGFDSGASSGQFDLAGLSRTTTPSPVDFDPRDQYRILGSKHHDIPAVKSVGIFGQPSGEVAQQLHHPTASHLPLNLHVPEYLIQPALFEEERCPLAAVYTDFRDYGRRRLAEGHSAEVVLGSPQVDLSVFFGGCKLEDRHTPNTWACQYMSLLKDLDIYVSLACVFTYSRFMRVSNAITQLLGNENELINTSGLSHRPKKLMPCFLRR
ncbi:hypothetical protein LTS17_010919 [Exophiala oligosperma]